MKFASNGNFDPDIKGGADVLGVRKREQTGELKGTVKGVVTRPLFQR